MKRKFILFITVLFSIVMLSSTTVVCAAEYREEPADVFQLILCADDSLVGGQSKPDLSGIKVEVSTLSQNTGIAISTKFYRKDIIKAV